MRATDKRKVALRAVKRSARKAGGGATDDVPDISDQVPPWIGDGGQLSKGYDWANKAAKFGSDYFGHVMQGVGDLATTPGKIMAPNPYKEGSEESVEYNRSREKAGLNWAPAAALALTAGGMGMAEPGAAGIFGGKLMKTWDRDAAAEALHQEARGIAPDRTWGATGTGRGADTQLRQEIDDSSATLQPVIDWKENKAGYVAGSLPYGRAANQVIDHPELFRNYPEAANIPIYPLAADSGKGGHFVHGYGDRPGHIAVTDQMWSPEGYRKTLLHELQHWVQNREGFQPGSSPSRFMPQIDEQVAQFEKAKADAESSIMARGVKKNELNDTKGFIKAYLSNPNVIRGDSHFSDIMYRLKQLPYYKQLENIVQSEMRLDKTKATATEKYMRTKGETEARNVEKRADFSEWERLNRSPESTQDRPNFLQINKPGFAEGGAVPDTFDPDKFAAFKASQAPAAPAAPAGDTFDPQKFAAFKAAQDLPDVGAPAIDLQGMSDRTFGPPTKGADWANNAADVFEKSAEKNIFQPIKHPLETLGGIGGLAAGVAQYAGAPGESFKPNVDALVKDYKDTYGSLEGIKKAVTEDPVRVAMDATGAMGLLRGAGRRAGVLPRPAAPIAAPTTAELRDASQGHYGAMHGFGVEMHPGFADNVAQNITNELHAESYRDYLAPKTFRAIDELRLPAGQTVGTQDMEGVRRLLQKVAADPQERDAARRAIGQIDHAMSNLSPADVAVNPQFATRVAAEGRLARGDYAAYKQAEQIETATDHAALQAASTGTGANMDNATRQKFRAIVTNPKKMRGYSPEEQATMRQLVEGNLPRNAARFAGKFAPSGVVSSGLSAMLGRAVGHTIGVPVLGWAAKQLADSATARAAARLSEQRRLRSPQARLLGSTAAPGWVPPVGGALQAGRLGAMTNNDNPYAP